MTLMLWFRSAVVFARFASSVKTVLKLPLDTALARSEVKDAASCSDVPSNVVDELSRLEDKDRATAASRTTANSKLMPTRDDDVGAGVGGNLASNWRCRRPPCACPGDAKPAATIEVICDMSYSTEITRTRVFLTTKLMAASKAEGWNPLSCSDDATVAISYGAKVGCSVGASVGRRDGVSVGIGLGARLGWPVGPGVGCGELVGTGVGMLVGKEDGAGLKTCL